MMECTYYDTITKTVFARNVILLRKPKILRLDWVDVCQRWLKWTDDIEEKLTFAVALCNETSNSLTQCSLVHLIK